MHTDKQLPTRRARLEEGSGTMAGAMLVMVVGIMMMVAASISNVLVCRTQARSLADVTAFVSASFWRTARTEDPCVVADAVAQANQVSLSQCVTRDEDVIVTVDVPTQVPFVTKVHGTSVAGPVNCD